MPLDRAGLDLLPVKPRGNVVVAETPRIEPVFERRDRTVVFERAAIPDPRSEGCAPQKFRPSKNWRIGNATDSLPDVRSATACSIRVSASVFERFLRIQRIVKSAKSFRTNTSERSESPLRTNLE